MKFPTEWKNKIHVPNHQPVMEVNQQWLGWLPFGNLFHSFGSHGPFTSMNYPKWWFLLFTRGFSANLNHRSPAANLNRLSLRGFTFGGSDRIGMISVAHWWHFYVYQKKRCQNLTLNGKNNDKPKDSGASLIFGQVPARVCVWIWWTKTVIGQKIVETPKKIGSFKNNITGMN